MYKNNCLGLTLNQKVSALLVTLIFLQKTLEHKTALFLHQTLHII